MGSGAPFPAIAAFLVLAGAALSGQQPSFRADTELVAVDVQVVNGGGVPVLDLTRENFDVRIGGRTRRVVSAQLMTTSESPSGLASSVAIPLSGRSVETSTSVRNAALRTFVVAVDITSFDHGTSRGIVRAARDFVSRLARTDYVGLAAYPDGQAVDPTTNHEAVLQALERVVGVREPPSLPLTPKDILTGGGAYALSRCGWSDIGCQRMIELQVLDVVGYYESLAKRSLQALRDVLAGLGRIDGRKTLVLVSGGMVAADSSAGRPNVGDLGTALGQEAARANVTIYTLFVDWRYLESASASKAGTPSGFSSEDSRVLSRWLEKFTDAAGGKLFTVFTGNGEYAFDSVLRETSSYYLLGVEPHESDRDGRPRELRVRVNVKARDVSVRARSWVTVPAR
jgi:VWFA-related protein